MYHKILADGFFVFSFFAIFLALVGFLVGDIWLASTQWVLVGIFTILVGIYTKLSAREDEEIIQVKQQLNQQKKPAAKTSKAQQRRPKSRKAAGSRRISVAKKNN